jgi:hippurate hydrolase
VRFLFQPGEEGYFGAKLMLEEGILTSTEAPAAAFALHIDPRLPSGKLACRSGPLMAAADVFAIELKGRGGHASMPHDTVDPIPVACEVVLALQTFVSRRIDAFDPVVLTVSKIDAGSTDNVIPEVASLLGTLRSFSERSRRRASQGLERIASRVAAAHEVEASTTVIPGYPVTVNDAGFVGFVRDVTTALLGEKSYIDMPAPIMGAEDFSYILQAIPGAMAFLGVRPEGVESPAPCHSNRMLLNEDALASGIAVHAAVAARYLGALA